jgi:hypothetical protein
MALCKGRNIEKGEIVFILSYLVARNFSVDDLGKDAWHKGRLRVDRE